MRLVEVSHRKWQNQSLWTSLGHFGLCDYDQVAFSQTFNSPKSWIWNVFSEAPRDNYKFWVWCELFSFAFNKTFWLWLASCISPNFKSSNVCFQVCFLKFLMFKWRKLKLHLPSRSWVNVYVYLWISSEYIS